MRASCADEEERRAAVSLRAHSIQARRPSPRSAPPAQQLTQSMADMGPLSWGCLTVCVAACDTCCGGLAGAGAEAAAVAPA